MCDSHLPASARPASAGLSTGSPSTIEPQPGTPSGRPGAPDTAAGSAAGAGTAVAEALGESGASDEAGPYAIAGARIFDGTSMLGTGHVVIAGGRIVAHGVSMIVELELLVGAGLSPSAALTGATSAPADSYRLPGRGRIEPGHRADLLLVNGDPTRDITAMRDVAAIWRNGARVDRAT